MATALYPGAFKPPHKGHFNVVKNLLSGNFYGTEYAFDDYEEKGDDLLKGKSGKVPGTDKTYTTQDKMVPKFKAGKGLKDRVAAGK